MPSVIMRAGAELTFETLVADRAPLRRRAEETLIRVLDGTVRLTVDGYERLLAIGDEAIVPAGAPHRLASASGGPARLVSGSRS
jgi:quercetin dioxygenase-like cupin family protein